MRKKILTTIALICVFSIPMMVNAREVEIDGKTCNVTDNYYLTHEAPGNGDAGVDEDSVNAQTTYYAYFDDTIGDKTIYEQDFVNMNSTNLRKYHTIWFDMLEELENSGNRVYRESDDTYYFIHRYYSTTSGSHESSFPFFYETYNKINSTLRNKLKDEVEESYYTDFDITDFSVLNEKEPDPMLVFRITRSYDIPYTTSGTIWEKPWLDMYEYYDAAGYPGHQFFRILPSMYKISYYDPETDCSDNQNEYTITYHSNNGQSQTQSDVVKGGTDYTIKDNMFTRSGYNFVGWSTNPDASQAESVYNPQSTFSVDRNLDLYAVWVSATGGKGTTDNSKTGLGYSIGIIAVVLAATAGGVVYFKKRNKFENI